MKLYILLHTGAIVAPINWRWSGKEVNAALKLCGATTVAVDGDCLQLLADALRCGELPVSNVLCLGQLQPDEVEKVLWPLGRQVHVWGVPSLLQHYSGTLSAGHTSCRTCLELQLRQPDDGTALICFTSGTTGQPKGVALSHAAFHVQSLSKLAMVHYNRADVYLHVAPLFHVGGLSSAFAMLMAGAGHVFMPR